MQPVEQSCSNNDNTDGGTKLYRRHKTLDYLADLEIPTQKELPALNLFSRCALRFRYILYIWLI